MHIAVVDYGSGNLASASRALALAADRAGIGATVAVTADPAVVEAAVVAAPDEERGAVVRAVVVLRDGHPPSDAMARELQNHVKATIAPYKHPRSVVFVEELPTTQTGKIQRFKLR